MTAFTEKFDSKSEHLKKLFQTRTEFPEGLHSFVNIQRQFFDSFVGQTFKVISNYQNALADLNF